METQDGRTEMVFVKTINTHTHIQMEHRAIAWVRNITLQFCTMEASFTAV